MLTHGLPKLGKLIAGDFNFANPIGLGSTISLILTVFAQVICSILIAFGLGTRMAVIPLIITMAVILLIVHGNDSILAHYNALLFLLGYFILLITGSGKYSLDYYLHLSLVGLYFSSLCCNKNHTESLNQRAKRN